MAWNDVKLNHTFTSVYYIYVFSYSLTTVNLNIGALIILIPANVTNGDTFSLIYQTSVTTFVVPEISLVLGT
jgi:hypothetical protein